jgi:phosphohistidine phosphatase
VPAAKLEAPTAKLEAPAAGPFPLELYLLRHGDAGDSSAWTGVDAERPLSKKGRRQAKALARTLRDLDLHVDAVITSPLLRAAQTAKPVAKALGVEVLTDQRLGYDFGTPQLAAIVAQLASEMQRVVLVGHDPGFTEVASHLLGARLAMIKGALARIDLADRQVKRGGGELRWLLPPDAVVR